jgi:hypothetical protein
MHYTNTDNPIDFPKSMDSQTKEVMDILQEECAEDNFKQLAKSADLV